LTIKIMLDFLYTGDYDISTEDSVTSLNLLAEIYSLADKYCADALMTTADRKYRMTPLLGLVDSDPMGCKVDTDAVRIVPGVNVNICIPLHFSTVRVAW
jgi:hypothetical protein